jgi:polysaccharide pyruvyl transferase WcaK-like protein
VIESRKKIACMIWGGYAKGNTGDELCLAAALERKQREFGDNVAVLSHRPEYTSQLFPNVNVVPYVPPDPKLPRPWKRFLRACKSLTTASGLVYFIQNTRLDPGLEWARCLSRAGQLYLAGGGYLTDLFPLDFIMPPIQFAIKLKLSVATAPIGIGPFKSNLHADKITAALRRMKLTVRDQTSLDFCRARGIDASLEPDDAFALVKNLLPPVSVNQPGVRPRKIGVCIFTQYGQDANCDLTGWWTESLRGLKAQHPEYEIEGFCFHTSLQAEFQEMTNLFSRAGLPADRVLAPSMDFNHAVEIIRSYDFIITTRFHAAVVANVFNIPNVAIAAGDYYQSKMSAAKLGFENICSLINPVCQPPEDLLNICLRELAVHESYRR